MTYARPYEVFGAERPVVGMVHLDPLPGAPRFEGDREAVRRAALRDARALASGGADGVLVENFGDAPFFPGDVPKHVVASMTAHVSAVAAEVDLPVGVNVLRNDAEAAVGIAAATDAAFVRVNVHVGARVADQGVIEGRAHRTLRLRDRLDADVAILADVDAKHSAPLATGEAGGGPIDAVERGLADGVVVTGDRTGRPTDPEDVARVVDELGEAGLDIPAFAGSGVTPGNADELLGIADGAIVGTALKEGGEVGNPVDEERVRALIDAVR